MLKDILIEAAISHSFEIVTALEKTIFLKKKDGKAERYLVLKEILDIPSADAVNEETALQIPESLALEPSFSKNCDLVLIHRLDDLSDFKKVEEQALEIEENPYHFKKYFFYYSDAEERAVKSKKLVISAHLQLN